jgi:signal transduction histidine kinase
MTQTAMSSAKAGRTLRFADIGIAARISPGLLLVIGFLILVTTSTATVWFVERTRSDADWVKHSLEVENKLSNLRVVFRRAESLERGYLLTGDQKDLKAYRIEVDSIGPALDDIGKSTLDNPYQQDALAKLRPAIDRVLEEARRTLQLYESGDKAGALALVRSGDHQARNDVSALIGRMWSEEQRLLNSRTEEAVRSGRWLLATVIIGALLVVGLAAVSLLQMYRSGQVVRAAHRELQQTNANLEAIVEQRTGHVREANEEIQRYAYIVSHDLRSPLVNIMGFTSELDAMRKSIFDRIASLRDRASDQESAAADDALAHEFDEALGFIKSSISRMDRLINAILKISREGQRRLQIERVDMSKLLQSIADTMAHQVQEAGASISIDALPAISSDRLALEQIFSNLVDNAVKYLRADVPGRIEVSATETPTVVIYTVRDNGRGIDQKDKERIFDLFRRAGPQDRPGEGVGLAHTRALARRLGGSISVDSTFGVGSEFKVTLPRRLTTAHA